MASVRTSIFGGRLDSYPLINAPTNPQRYTLIWEGPA